MSGCIESELDEKVISMVRFFNEHGLPTCMSCQGHNDTNMSLFWIQFHKSVTRDNILKIDFAKSVETWTINRVNDEINRVIFNNPATIVFWNDGTKTVVKCQDGDVFSKETGLMAAMLKRYMGNDNTYNKVLSQWLGDED